MTHFQRIAFIGNSLPRRCGIATFTPICSRRSQRLRPDIETCVVAMTDHGHAYDYPAAVRLQIHDDKRRGLWHAADVPERRPVRRRLAAARVRHFRRRGRRAHPDAALAADHADRHDAPHGACRSPRAAQRAVWIRSSKSRRESSSWPRRGGICCEPSTTCRREKIEVIPHGIPDFAFVEPDEAKARFGFAARPSF